MKREDITASKKVSLSSPWRGSAASSWGCRGAWRMHGWSGSALSVGRVALALDTRESSACTLADRLERACGILAVAWTELLHKHNNKIAHWCSDNSRGICRFWPFLIKMWLHLSQVFFVCIKTGDHTAGPVLAISKLQAKLSFGSTYY